MMRKLLIATLLLAAGLAHAQGVGINTTGAAADTSAILDLSSTTKGLLVPRLTSAQRAAIVLPATGLVVYQTDGTAGLYWNAGTPAVPSWKQVGEAGTGGGGQWATSGSNLYYSAGKVAVGTTPTQFRLAVQDTGTVFRVQASNPTGLLASFGGTGQLLVDAPNVPGGRLALLGNGNLGLGVANPTSKLSFAPTLGKKISLYSSGANDYGLGLASGRLQIFSDGFAGGDVAIGTDDAGAFTEKFAVKNNGALAVGGNPGVAGQMLQSNGSGAAASWVAPSSITAAHRTVGTGPVVVTGSWVSVPGLESLVSVSRPSNILVTFSIPIRNLSSTSPVTIDIGFSTWSNFQKRFPYTLAPGTATVASGSFLITNIAIQEAVFVSALASSSPGAEIGSPVSYYAAELVLTAVPQ